MKKIIYLILICFILSSCAKSFQPTTLKQEEQKRLRKNEHRKIVNIILVFNMVCILVLYDQVEKFDK